MTKIEIVHCKNVPVFYSWEVTEWNICSLSCATGTQSRRIRCMTLSSKGGVYEVDDSKCDESTKPTNAIVQKCNDHSCPAHWEVSNCISNISSSSLFVLGSVFVLSSSFVLSSAFVLSSSFVLQ